MPTTVATTPPGHRRISSFRRTTLSYFKGRQHAQHHPPPAPFKRTELTISNPIPTAPTPLEVEEDDVSPTEIPPLRGEQHHYFAEHGRSTSTFDKRRPSQADTVMTADVVSSNYHHRDNHSVRSKTSDGENITSDTSTTAASARSRRGGTKLRMALSLLRRRSRENLRKAYVEPIGEAAEEREPSWGPGFKEPLLDPDLAEGNEYAPRRTDTRSAPPPERNEAPIKSHHGFKFALPARSNTRHVLTKPPPHDPLRQRRATVASIVVDSSTPPLNPWADMEARPRSSQSSDPGLTPDMGADSIFSRESAALGNSPGGGLFPRPASLQREFSDGMAPRKRESHARPSVAGRMSTTSRLSHQVDRVRPVSFGGVSSTATNLYGNMKITEAASLESRVRDLENTVARLQNQLLSRSPGMNWPLPEQQLSSPEPQPVFLDPTSSSSSSDESSSSREELHHPSPHDLRLILNPNEEEDRIDTLQALEGLTLNIDPANKRATVSTIRGPTHRGSSSLDGASTIIPTTEYNSLLSLLRKEQRARRRLESQVSTLQEQMTTVLHRELIRKSVSVTPPQSSQAPREPQGLWKGFDGGSVPTDTDDDSMFDRPGMEGSNKSERWETPTEERGLDELSPPAILREERTLSLSQLTTQRRGFVVA